MEFGSEERRVQMEKERRKREERYFRGKEGIKKYFIFRILATVQF